MCARRDPTEVKALRFQQSLWPRARRQKSPRRGSSPLTAASHEPEWDHLLMDPWHGLVYFILFWVALTVGAHTFNELRRRRNRTGKLQRLQAEPVEQPPQMPDGRPAAPGEAIRCVMFELVPGLKTWVVAIDIEQDVIRVRQSARRTGFRIPRFDPEKSSLIASAWRTQVTATPAAFMATAKRGIGRTMPVLIVRVPGLQPLTIGCDENIGFRWSTSASSLRFWWR